MVGMWVCDNDAAELCDPLLFKVFYHPVAVVTLTAVDKHCLTTGHHKGTVPLTHVDKMDLYLCRALRGAAVSVLVSLAFIRTVC